MKDTRLQIPILIVVTDADYYPLPMDLDPPNLAPAASPIMAVTEDVAACTGQ